MKTFDTDLNQGRKIENEFALLFVNKGYNVTTTQDKGLFNDYDVAVENPDNGTTVTFEIKHDRLANIRKNVAVEVSKTIDGKTVPSGLSVSKADLFVYKFGQEKTFYAMDTEKLWEFIQQGKYDWEISAGDGGRSNLKMFSVDFFKKHSAKINSETI